MISIKKKYKSGQTLIETLAALFILVMGISATVGLAVYAFSSSTNINKEIVATGLAREGLETIRNMRDTNWLWDTLATNAIGNNCNIYNSSTGTSSCYPNWIGGGAVPFCLDPTKTSAGCSGIGGPSFASFVLGFNDSTTGPVSVLTKVALAKYGLVFDSTYPLSAFHAGFYSPNGGVACDNSVGMSDYCRKIVITKDTTTFPYNQDPNGSLALLKVQSQVWWVDKKCPRSADWPGPTSCSVELDTYLTNWKNYSVSP